MCSVPQGSSQVPYKVLLYINSPYFCVRILRLIASDRMATIHQFIIDLSTSYQHVHQATTNMQYCRYMTWSISVVWNECLWVNLPTSLWRIKQHSHMKDTTESNLLYYIVLDRQFGRPSSKMVGRHVSGLNHGESISTYLLSFAIFGAHGNPSHFWIENIEIKFFRTPSRYFGIWIGLDGIHRYLMLRQCNNFTFQELNAEQWGDAAYVKRVDARSVL